MTSLHINCLVMQIISSFLCLCTCTDNYPGQAAIPDRLQAAVQNSSIVHRCHTSSQRFMRMLELL